MERDVSKKIRYRTESFSGQGEREAAKVMAYETFEMGNVDILEMLESTLLNNSPELRDRCLVFIDELQNSGFVDDFSFEDGIAFFKEVLTEIKKITGFDVKYVLWLADKETVTGTEYGCYGRDMYSEDDYNAYEVGPVVLSDLGFDGTLYGYEELPKPLEEKIERKFSDLYKGEISEAVDQYFAEHGWKLELWKDEYGLGYQVFFGEGVQVDNYFEYGFPYLYEKEEVIGFMEKFYESHIELEKEHVPLKNSIYVCKTEDGKWDCSMENEENGLFLVQEQEYPVKLYYSRLDLNGSSNMECDALENREELLKALEWHGTCNHVIEQVWDFNIKSCGEEIFEFFKEVYDIAMNSISAYWLEEEEVGIEAISSLDTKIQNVNIEKKDRRVKGPMELNEI